MYSNFMFLDRLLFELPCKTERRTHTHTHTDSEEYSIVAFTMPARRKKHRDTGC